MYAILGVRMISVLVLDYLQGPNYEADMSF